MWRLNSFPDIKTYTPLVYYPELPACDGKMCNKTFATTIEKPNAAHLHFTV